MGEPITVSDLITEPKNSLIHQSYSSEEREEPLNGDGFGLAWYAHGLSEEPGVFRSVSPAWSNRNLHHLARVTRSHCVLAHVRAASDGTSVTELDCHPFVTGPFAFMHNGELGGFHRLRRALINQLSDARFALLQGNTDSEFLFAYFLDRYDELAEVGDATRRLEMAMDKTIFELTAFVSAYGITEPSYLNMAVCDGHHAVISRYTTDEPRYAESLHLHTGKVYRCVKGVCQMLDPETQEGAIIVSSEKLSDDPGWETVPPNFRVTVKNDRSAKVKALEKNSP
jgi:glutamine amidotransferase